MSDDRRFFPPFVGGSPGAYPGLDVAEGVGRMGGDAQIYRLILQKFAETQTAPVTELRQAHDAGHWEDVHRVVHSFKGVLGNISANDLFHLLQDLEGELRRGRTEGLADRIALIEVKFRELLASIESYVAA